jgi:hypothetical protein
MIEALWTAPSGKNAQMGSTPADLPRKYRSGIDVGVNEQFPRLARQPLSTVSVESVSTFNTLLSTFNSFC